MAHQPQPDWADTQFCLDNGINIIRNLGDGRVAYIAQMTFGNYRINVTSNPWSIDNGY